MSAIPAFILKKLYVTGSLCNTSEGCQLQIANLLAPATITGAGPITIDGVAYPAAVITVVRGSEHMAAATVNSAHPVTFDINSTVTLVISGATLSAGEHHVVIDVNTREAGRLKIDITDQVTA